MATKRTDYSGILSTWKGLIKWLQEQNNEKKVKECLMFEIKNQNRAQFIDRARTRFNKLRAYRELKELERLSGKVINVNYL